jgi:hypothetical protein
MATAADDESDVEMGDGEDDREDDEDAVDNGEDGSAMEVDGGSHSEAQKAQVAQAKAFVCTGADTLPTSHRSQLQNVHRLMTISSILDARVAGRRRRVSWRSGR